MFTLFKGLWQYLFQKDEYFILIIGLDNAGKSTLLEHIKRKYAIREYQGIPFEKIAPTIGMNVGRIDMKTDILVLWDLGGQTELQSLWSKYFTDCHGVIYVVDSSDSARLQESYECFESLISHKELTNVPLLVLANKQDKPNTLNAENIKQTFNQCATNLGKRDCTLHEVSALSGNGLDESMQWILECVKRNIYRPPKTKEIT